MTKRKLVSLLIKDYQWAIEEVNKIKTVKEIKKLLSSAKLDCGICHVSRTKHREYIYDKKWVEKLNNYNGKYDSNYWCEIPYDCSTKKQILQSLETRLEILKSIYK
jgi:predicted N-acyltransferase